MLPSRYIKIFFSEGLLTLPDGGLGTTAKGAATADWKAATWVGPVATFRGGDFPHATTVAGPSLLRRRLPDRDACECRVTLPQGPPLVFAGVHHSFSSG